MPTRREAFPSALLRPPLPVRLRLPGYRTGLPHLSAAAPPTPSSAVSCRPVVVPPAAVPPPQLVERSSCRRAPTGVSGILLAAVRWASGRAAATDDRHSPPARWVCFAVALQHRGIVVTTACSLECIGGWGGLILVKTIHTPFATHRALCCEQSLIHPPVPVEVRTGLGPRQGSGAEEAPTKVAMWAPHDSGGAAAALHAPLF